MTPDVCSHVLKRCATLEGDDTAYGQALFPVPAEDPNDPLQVRYEKLVMKVVVILISCDSGQDGRRI